MSGPDGFDPARQRSSRNGDILGRRCAVLRRPRHGDRRTPRPTLHHGPGLGCDPGLGHPVRPRTHPGTGTARARVVRVERDRHGRGRPRAVRRAPRRRGAPPVAVSRGRGDGAAAGLARRRLRHYDGGVHRIAVLDDYQYVAATYADWSRLPEPVEVVEFADHVDDQDTLVRRLQPFDVIVAMRERTPFPRGLLERLPNLRLLVTTGARNPSIDVAAADERGIPVCGTGAHPPGTAELTWALILAVARNLPQEDASVRAGGWQQTIGADLAGGTLGVLGLGRLGERVARIGLAFGMDVVAWSQNLTDGRAAEVGARRVERDELLATADVVTVPLQLSDRTRGLVGRAELTRMKATAILVNTSRGPIVDEQALVEALRGGAIRGAGLDVFDQEPLPRHHPLRELRRAVLTPHLGYVTEKTYEVFYRDAVEDVAAFLAGQPTRVITPA